MLKNLQRSGALKIFLIIYLELYFVQYVVYLIKCIVFV
jgi:hypothetical protein